MHWRLPYRRCLQRRGVMMVAADPLWSDISLVASELATNALNHCGTPFTVTLTAFADHIILAVRDGSAGWPIRLHAQPDAAAGRGMAIVDVVSRDWGVVLERGVGKTVWAAFDVG